MSDVVNTEDLTTKGKINTLGVNIDIAATLGGILAENYLAQISEEQIQALYDHISSDLFQKESYYLDKIKIKVKTSTDRWTTSDETLLANRMKAKFNEIAKDKISEKCEEILHSEKYTKMIDNIAEELVEYAVNGYKEDLKTRIRTRLVNNITDEYPYYGRGDLITIINEEVDKRLYGNN